MYNIRFLRNIGKLIGIWFHLQDSKEKIDIAISEAAPLLNDTKGERDLLADATTFEDETEDSLEGNRDSLVSVVEDYITGEISDLLEIDIADAEIEDILDRLDDGMTLANDCVLENYNIVSTPVADPDNVGGSVCSITDQTQWVHDDMDFEVECYDASTPGAELWRVKNTDDDNRGIATSNEEFTDELYGVSFIISGTARVNDQHFFHTDTSGIGLYQYFMVNALDYALPSCTSGLNTVPEEWARFEGCDF